MVLRRLRLAPVGSISHLSPDDHSFLRHARVNCFPVKFLPPCPLRGISQLAARYRRFMHASKLKQAMELGANVEDIRQAYEKGFVSFSRNEPDFPGHVFNAFSLAADQGFVHALIEARHGSR